MSKYWDIILSRFFDRPVFRQLSKHWEFSNFLCFDNPIFRQLSKHWDVEAMGSPLPPVENPGCIYTCRTTRKQGFPIFLSLHKFFLLTMLRIIFFETFDFTDVYPRNDSRFAVVCFARLNQSESRKFKIHDFINRKSENTNLRGNVLIRC